VIDVAAGEKIPRKGGPGITKSDLFVINKTDLAPHVGADLDVMARRHRAACAATPEGLKPFVMTNLKTLTGLDAVVAFIEEKGMLDGLIRQYCGPALARGGAPYHPRLLDNPEPGCIRLTELKVPLAGAAGGRAPRSGRPQRDRRPTACHRPIRWRRCGLWPPRPWALRH
jgi:hypothetical protein